MTRSEKTRAEIVPQPGSNQGLRLIIALFDLILDVHCNNTEFVCTDKMFQVSTEDRDYDELTAVQHGFFMSCEESFANVADLYFHFVGQYCKL